MLLPHNVPILANTEAAPEGHEGTQVSSTCISKINKYEQVAC